MMTMVSMMLIFVVIYGKDYDCDVVDDDVVCWMLVLTFMCMLMLMLEVMGDDDYDDECDDDVYDGDDDDDVDGNIRVEI